MSRPCWALVRHAITPLEVTVAQRRVFLNPRGMRELLQSEAVSRDLHERMRPVLAAAIAAKDVSGDYEDSLHIVDDVTLGAKGRARCRVVADVDYALKREAKDRTLGRAMDAAGD